jgi:hypothetical protein
MVNNFSDVIVADISGTFFGLRFSFFTFASDAALLSPTEKGFIAAFLGKAALVTPEDGTLQTISFRDLRGAVESLPFDLTVKAISDKNTPEPSAWLLFATGAVVLLGAWRRERIRMVGGLHY